MDDLTLRLDASQKTCSDASADCLASKQACEAATGASAFSLQEGGKLVIGNSGTLSLTGGRLTFCDPSNTACTTLNAPA